MTDQPKPIAATAGRGPSLLPERAPWRPARRDLLSGAAGALVAGLVSGCGRRSAQNAPPTEFEITVTTTDSINPNEDNVPSPVVIRLYQLKSDTTFKSAEFFQLFDEDTKTLGADLISKDEFEFPPGTTRRIRRESVSPDLQFIGVLAAFRQIQAATWRAVSKVDRARSNLITITVTTLSVSLSVQRRGI